VQQLSPELLAFLTTQARNHLAERETIIILNATISTTTGLMKLISVPETGASWPNNHVTVVDFPGFAWIEESNHDSV
jgi:hypothetical protein